MTTDGEYKQLDWLQREDFIFLGFIIKLRTEMNIVKIAFIFPKGKSRCVNNTNSSWIFENVFSNEKMACTFALLVGGECGPDARSRNRSCEIVPLVSCNEYTEPQKIAEVLWLRNRSGAYFSAKCLFSHASKYPGNDHLTFAARTFGYWLAEVCKAV